MSGTVDELVAGRHIGNRDKKGIILVRGDIDTVDVSGGQLYADLRVGQQITGSVLIGMVDNTPGADLLGAGSIIAFGRINSIVIEGDFDGDIISSSGGIGTITINNGSFLPGNTISAFAGSIDRIIINAGHLLGDVHADHFLSLIQLNASLDGVFGDIGINLRGVHLCRARGRRDQRQRIDPERSEHDRSGHDDHCCGRSHLRRPRHVQYLQRQHRRGHHRLRRRRQARRHGRRRRHRQDRARPQRPGRKQRDQPVHQQRHDRRRRRDLQHR